MRRGLAILLMVLLAPHARASDEADPEVDDARDLREPSLDLLSAWFAPHRDGVAFTIKVAGLDDDVADHLYFITFTLHGEKQVAALGYDADGTLRGHAGNAAALRRARGIETFPQNLQDLEARAGSPGYLSAVIPWGALDGLQPDVALVDIAAGTSLYHRERGAWDTSVDARGTDRTYLARRVALGEGAGPWLAAGAVGLALAGGGGATAYVLLRRKPEPPSVQVPVQAAPPAWQPPREPPKPRFTLRPPE